MKTLLVLAVLLLVLGTGTAYAECAWVLWRRSVEPYGPGGPGSRKVVHHYVPEGATSTERACYEWGKKIPTAQQPTDPNVRNEYLCLPDTVDPRGVKGAR